MPFEWDADKASANALNHAVTFDEAVTVFDDFLAVVFEDVIHSGDEPRGLIVGYSTQGRLLFISYTERGETIRIISARLATKREREKHEREAHYGQ